MAIIKRKRGIIFSIVAILLVGVLIASMSIVAKTTYKQKSFIASSRVNSMNDFIFSIHQDAERNLMISGYRAIISLQKDIAEKGDFVSNFSNAFQELIVNGSINNTPQDLMGNASINDWASRINIEAEKLNIEVIISPLSITTYQTTPWTITIELNANINMTDFNNLASWNYNKTFKKNIDIISFEDPLYTVKSNNKVTNIVNKANNTDFVNATNNDTSVLYLHLNNSNYISSTAAPSFIMRFEGNLSSSEYGIESLVNLAEFSRQNIETYDKSVIDYEYFNNSYSGVDKCGFPNMPSWFRIDTNKVGNYNLTGLGGSCA